MPNILIIYANDQQRQLAMLEKESKEISRLLDRVPHKNYSVKMIPAVQPAELLDELANNGHELEILHYSGHADSRTLFFAEQEIKSGNLADRLSLCPNLKLVFLNGCATMGQIANFHAAGVPYVVATSREVEDTKSYWIAAQFYQYLTLAQSVEEAFESIRKDGVVLEKNLDLAVVRGSQPAGEELDDNGFEWGLYAKENARPYFLPLRKFVLQERQSVEHGNFLSSLLLSLGNYKSPLSRDFKDTIDNIETLGDADENTKLNDLLKILPYPIGIRLRQINAKAKTEDNEEEYYRQLLLDYACFFETLLQYAFAMRVSQLWQYGNRLQPESAGEEFENMRSFICSNRLAGELKECAIAIQSAATLFGVSGIKNPLPGIDGALGYFGSHEFSEACSFFDMHKDYYWRKVRPTPEEAIRHCYQAQGFLETAFRHFGFIIENVLASVRYINVINFRHVEESYANEVWQLLASEDGTVRHRRHKKPMENKSVLCFSAGEFDAETPSINLFPFFIDRSAFARQAGNVVDIYQFAGYFQDEWVNGRSKQQSNEPCFYYISLRNPGQVWRFNDKDVANASLYHIEDSIPEGQIPAHMKVEVAGELKGYFQEFKFFLKLKP
jgi:hypothetical protein